MDQSVSQSPSRLRSHWCSAVPSVCLQSGAVLLLILLLKEATDWTLTQYQVQDFRPGNVTRLLLLFSTITPPAGGSSGGRCSGEDCSHS